MKLRKRRFCRSCWKRDLPRRRGMILRMTISILSKERKTPSSLNI